MTPKRPITAKSGGDEMVAILVPCERLHDVRVALHPIRQGEPTSAATEATRDELRAACIEGEREQ